MNHPPSFWSRFVAAGFGMALGLGIACSADARNLVVNGPFEGSFAPVGKTTVAIIEGVLPESWQEDSGHNDVIGPFPR